VTVELFLQHLANGVSLGSLYALIAIGYTMVYGILRLINFAHGDIIMIACYFAFYGVAIFVLPWPVSVALAVLLTTGTGMLIERSAYRPLRQAPRISLLISAIGVSFLLENLGLVVFGGRPKAFMQPDFLARAYQIGGVSVAGILLVIPLLTAALLVGLNYLVYRTKVGVAMRAASWDFDTSRIMGINVDRVVALTFAIGSALAAVGGIMWAIRYPQINPLMGIIPGLKCFIAAVFGGIGSIPGAMLGGLLLGIGEIMLVAFMPDLAGFRDAFAFVLLIIMLLFRPSGLLGRRTVVKV